MSNDVLPALPGLTWDQEKAPEFSTSIQRSVSLTELRGSYADAPVWHFKRSYELLRDDATNNELQQLAGFFLDHLGRWDSWLYTDPDDYIVANQVIGTGNGSATTFQLYRSFGAFNEPIANANTITLVSVNNTPTSNYTHNTTTGIITFNSPPAANGVVRWSGTYYYRCRFKDDTMQFSQFMRQLWEAKSFEFVGSLGTAI